MSDDAEWHRLIQGLRDGDRAAVGEFCMRYGTPLERLAERHLPAALRRRVGADDVVQSACRTFLRRTGRGEFQLPDSEALWRLLSAITLTKLREQSRFHLRERRGLGREDDPAAAGDTPSAMHPADPGPSPAEAAAFTEQFEDLLRGMDEEERQLIDLKLQDYTNEETAERMGCSERTVRRILKRVQGRLARAFDDA